MLILINHELLHYEHNVAHYRPRVKAEAMK